LQGSISDPEEHGIVPRAVQILGEGIAADKSNAEYEVCGAWPALQMCTVHSWMTH